MMAEIVSLRQHQLPQVYDMMLLQAFPDVPETLEEALVQLAGTKVLGLYGEGVLQAAFILMDFTENAACLDVVCHPMAHGRWASKRTLKQLYRTIFEAYGLDYLWAEPKNARAAKTCFQAGFQLLPDMGYEAPVMVLTRRNFANLIEHKRN